MIKHLAERFLREKKWKHHKAMPNGIRGEVSKIEEEIAEYKDADLYWWKVTELSDIIVATCWVAWKHYRVPAIVLCTKALIRMVYKPIRNKLLGIQ